MESKPPNEKEVAALRAIAEAFILERLTPKLEAIDKKIAGTSDLEKSEKLQEDREELLAGYQREAWVDDAARRVSQIQAVTHAVKYAHPPDIKSGDKSTSIYFDAAIGGEHRCNLLGTHSVGEGIVSDVVGNAAALDVNKF
jgi:CRISPR-associated protein Csy1